MHEKVYEIHTTEYTDITELPEKDQKLVFASREASLSAYAPYSNFQVGAALELANGSVIKGNNQENSDFTDGLCAERVAMFFANANFPDLSVKALAVSARNKGVLIEGPALPCGSCRQVFIETEHRFKQPIRIILDGVEKILVFEGAANLLPFAFILGEQG